MDHHLKAHPDSFELLALRKSEVQLRKNDRDFRIGDTCHFYEWIPERGVHSGRRVVPVPVVEVLTEHEGLTPGWCLIVLGVPTTHITTFDGDVAGISVLPVKED